MRNPLANRWVRLGVAALLVLAGAITFGSVASAVCLGGWAALYWGRPVAMAATFLMVTSLAVAATKTPASHVDEIERFVGPPRQDAPVGRPPASPTGSPAPTAAPAGPAR